MADNAVPLERQWALMYFIDSDEEKTITKRKTLLKSNLLAWILENCDPDENGNYIYEFDQPVHLDDETYTGLTAQRRVSEFLNEERAWELVEKYDPDHTRCVEIVEELDVDQLYAMNQEGIISDEEIDSILEQSEIFALVKNR